MKRQNKKACLAVMLLLPCVAYGQQRSKTIELQIEKSQVLIEGLNRNIAELRPKGVKDAFANHKRIVKTNYPQERWINYGVQDKR